MGGDGSEVKGTRFHAHVLFYSDDPSDPEGQGAFIPGITRLECTRVLLDAHPS